MTKVRHILGISGGKDSAALSIYLKQKYPQLKIEYYNSDTGCELAETEVLIDRLSAYLGSIKRLRAALTDLFQSIKTDETPVVVENVVNDIDNEVVNIVRQFNDAFKSITAQREIKKKLRSILWIKYSIKDNDVFEKAYQYIEMYY